MRPGYELKPCGHVAPVDAVRPEWCTVCEDAERAELLAERLAGGPCCVGCGVLLTAAELQDEGRDECGPCHAWATSHEPAGLPVTVEGEAEAVTVMRELAAALNVDEAPPVAELPFSLVPEVRRESKREAAAKAGRLPL